MGQLRDRMEQDLKLKGVRPATIRNYLLYARKFAGFFLGVLGRPYPSSCSGVATGRKPAPTERPCPASNSDWPSARRPASAWCAGPAPTRP